MKVTSYEDGVAEIELTRRNLLVLLKKLDHNASDPDVRSECTIVSPPGPGIISVKAVEDEEHYVDRAPGVMLDNENGRTYEAAGVRPEHGHGVVTMEIDIPLPPKPPYTPTWEDVMNSLEDLIAEGGSGCLGVDNNDWHEWHATNIRRPHPEAIEFTVWGRRYHLDVAREEDKHD